MFSETLDNRPLAKVFMPLMNVPNWKFVEFIM